MREPVRHSSGTATKRLSQHRGSSCRVRTVHYCIHSFSLHTHYCNPVQNLAARRWVTRLIIAALALIGARAGAQGVPRFASPALPPNHWAVSAARRAIVLGLTPREIGWAEGSLTQALAGWALREA